MSQHSTAPLKKKTHHTFWQRKAQGERFAMLTAYDYTTARLLDAAGIDALLVGDSLAMTMLGHANTLSLTLEEMLHHVKAVARASQQAWVVADAPFGSYHISVEESIRNLSRLITEGGADAIKLEGAGVLELAVVQRLTQMGLPVVGHLGLTPQHVLAFGGFKRQARTAEAAEALLQHALALQAAGAVALVLEMVPLEVAAAVQAALSIPTIGIGAGPACDAQVLVGDDALGRFEAFQPSFVRRFANVGEATRTAAMAYQTAVLEGSFPARIGESVAMATDELQRWLHPTD